MEGTQIVFLALAGGLVMLWLAVALTRRRPPATPGILAELHYGRFLRLFALVIALIIPALMAYVVWFLPWIGPEHLVIAGGAFSCMSVLGGLLLLETEKVRLYVAGDRLVGLSPWRRRREIAWHDVQDVSYSRLNRWFVITGPGGRRIRASRSLVGLPVLLAAIREKVPADRWKEVRGLLEQSLSRL